MHPIVRREYRDEKEISMSILESKGDIVYRNELSSNELSNMVEGEGRFDIANNRKLYKINGVLHKQVVDANNEIKLIEI